MHGDQSPAGAGAASGTRPSPASVPAAAAVPPGGACAAAAPVPASVPAALAAVRAGLDYLNGVDAASLPTAVQADCLRALARAESAHTAAQARVLAAFMAQDGQAADGQANARAWLKWQTRVTGGAAAGAAGWARRLAAHPATAVVLAAGAVSASWAREICHLADQLPAAARDRAEEILLAAAQADGVCLADLAMLADTIRSQTAAPGPGHPGPGHPGDGAPGDAPGSGDGGAPGGPGPGGAGGAGDGFEDRQVYLGITFGGAGYLRGDLTPECAAAVQAVLDALGGKRGPEDTRTAGQRRHDALEEACQRLAGSGFLPGQGGQPAWVQLHLTLDQLRGLPGAAGAEATWATARAAGNGQPGWLAGPAAQAYTCDARITPIVTGQVNPAALTALAEEFLAQTRPGPGTRPGTGTGAAGPLPAATRQRLHDTLLRHAADVLSGPAGLAAFLRTRVLAGQFASVSLPLEAGAAASHIPPHLRNLARARHPHCAFPGCDQPARACHIHHLHHRADGGPTRLDNLVPLCPFHHLTAVHRWGWQLTLHANGTITATSPDHNTTLHSHGPPGPPPDQPPTIPATGHQDTDSPAWWWARPANSTPANSQPEPAAGSVTGRLSR